MRFRHQPMITSREVDGPLGRLRVEKTWAEIGGNDFAGYQLTLMSATLDGELVFWPQSQEIAEAYAAEFPDFRAWLERARP